MPPDGFLNLLKPPGMTSSEVVSFVRRRLGVSRIGHFGTLDPAAAGVLAVSVGRVTRLFDYAGGDKAYRAEVCFGLTTDTLDAEGRVASRQDASAVTADQVRDALAAMVGEQVQVPPAYSAAQVGGQRLHELARRGQHVVAPARTVHFHRLELADFHSGLQARALLDVVCSAGTYIRVLADDLGRTLGCGAYLAFLVRTRAGRFTLADALTLEEVEGFGAALSEHLLASDWPLLHLPSLSLRRGCAVAFVSGSTLSVEAPPSWPVRVYDGRGLFLGLGEVTSAGQLRPRLTLVAREELQA